MIHSVIAAAAAVLLLALPACAETLKPGDAMPALALSDQHDQAGAIGADTRLVLFTKDMDASDHVEQALADDGAARLAAAKAVFVADISRMPAVITRMFALPALRKRPYRMLLDRDGEATAVLPSVEQHVTLLRLDQGRIASVEFAASADAVNAALRAASAP